MPARSLMTLLAGLAVGTLIGAQVHGAGAAKNPCPAPTVVKLAFASPTPTRPRPTARDNRRGNALLTMEGNYVARTETDSAVFHAAGPFSIHYTSKMLDTSQYSTATFEITVFSVHRSLEDLVDDPVVDGLFLDNSKPTPNGTSVLRSDDCSKGCYLEVTAENLAYTVQVTQ